MPEYPGGMRAGLEFMERNLGYPTKAREAGKQGRVIVQFTLPVTFMLEGTYI